MLAKLLLPVLLAVLPALPAVAQEPPAVLRIGIVAQPGAGQLLRGASEIRRAFSQATGLRARIFVARDMAALVEAQAGGRVHYAIYSAAGFAAAQAVCSCVEPLVAPVGTSGDIGLRAVVYARAQASSGLAAAAAARVVGGPAEPVGPHLLAAAAMTEADAGSHILETATQLEAEASFARGEADVLVGWEAVAPDELETPAAGTSSRLSELGLELSDYTAIWASDIVRYGPHAVRTDLPDAVKQSLKTFLLHLHRQQPVVYDLLESRHLGGFAEVSQDDYRTAERMVALAAR